MQCPVDGVCSTSIDTMLAGAQRRPVTAADRWKVEASAAATSSESTTRPLTTNETVTADPSRGDVSDPAMSMSAPDVYPPIAAAVTVNGIAASSIVVTEATPEDDPTTEASEVDGTDAGAAPTNERMTFWSSGRVAVRPDTAGVETVASKRITRPWLGTSAASPPPNRTGMPA